MKLNKRFILWLYKRRHRVEPVHLRVTEWKNGAFGFRRWPLLSRDQYRLYNGKLVNKFHPLQPFNILLHWWRPAYEYEEKWHDHPRWSISIVLRGSLIEEQPKRTLHLRAGSVVFRSHKTIHRFRMPPEHRGKTWTLFIVGPRIHPQGVYDYTRVETPDEPRTQPRNKVNE